MIRRRVLVADGAPLFRSGVRHLLTREGDFVLTEAADFDELMQVMEHEAPEIALIDLDLPPSAVLRRSRTSQRKARHGSSSGASRPSASKSSTP